MQEPHCSPCDKTHTAKHHLSCVSHRINKFAGEFSKWLELFGHGQDLGAWVLGCLCVPGGKLEQVSMQNSTIIHINIYIDAYKTNANAILYYILCFEYRPNRLIFFCCCCCCCVYFVCLFCGFFSLSFKNCFGVPNNRWLCSADERRGKTTRVSIVLFLQFQCNNVRGTINNQQQQQQKSTNLQRLNSRVTRLTENHAVRKCPPFA